MAPTSGAAGLTCRKCALGFSTRKEAKEHYGSEWHSTNVKRVMQGQKSITLQEFTASRNKASYVKEGKNVRQALECKTCHKKFLSQGSQDTHMRSRKHKDGIRKKAAEQYRKMKEEREQKRLAESANPDYVEEESDEETDDTKIAQHCATCDQTFASRRDHARHVATQRHKDMVEKYRIEHQRRAHLDRLDQQDQLAITNGEEDWEDMEEDEEEEGDEEEDGDDVEMEEEDSASPPLEWVEDDSPIPPGRCVFCPKAFPSIPLCVSHMERQHHFIVPHPKAADMEKLFQYIGQKVGAEHRCLDCSRPFASLRGVRAHMLAKPCHELRFEGEYDGYWDVAAIVAPLAHIPLQAAADHAFALPLADGTLLTHRDLKRYFKQRLSEKIATKRLRNGGPDRLSLTHLGKTDPKATSVMERRKAQNRQQRALTIITRTQKKKRLNQAVKANKMQPHFRPQVINAG